MSNFLGKNKTPPAAAKPEETPKASEDTTLNANGTLPETAPETPDEAAPKKTEVSAKGVEVKSVVGLMIHPFKPFRFDGEKPVPMVEIDSWTQSQIDAGKLEVVK